MDGQITALYCLCDDVLKALQHYEDPHRQMTDAEVMTTAIVAALHFGGNVERARAWLSAPRYIPQMLSKSRFNRRLHALQDLLVYLFRVLGEIFKALNADSVYLIDSFPVPVCDNIRIPRSKLYGEKRYRGYTASKRRYFYGLKIFLLVTAQGEPVELFLTPGAVADVNALHIFDFDLPEGSTVTAIALSPSMPLKTRCKRLPPSTSSPCARKTPSVLCQPMSLIFKPEVAKSSKPSAASSAACGPRAFMPPPPRALS